MPKQIKYKPDRLTPEEREFIRKENIKDLVLTIAVLLLAIAMIAIIVYTTYAVSAEMAQ